MTDDFIFVRFQAPAFPPSRTVGSSTNSGWRSGASTPPRHRDRSREPHAGTSVGYAVRRLEREAREDPVAAVACERLQGGEIGANAAMIEAGFRPRTIQLPLDPSRAGRLLARHTTVEQFEDLVDACKPNGLEAGDHFTRVRKMIECRS